MASENYSAAIAAVFAEEGGYVNHPDDPGGPTNMGITQATLAAWRKRPVSAADVQAMPKAEAEAIYRAQYATPIRFNDLPAGIDLMVLDWAVHSGPATAAKALQRLLSVNADGIIGAKTLAAVEMCKPSELVAQLKEARLAYLQKLKTWSTFGKGWTKRVNRVSETAQAMAAREPVPRARFASFDEPETAKAPPADIKLSATTAGKGNLIAGTAAVLGVGIEVAQQVAPQLQALGAVEWAQWLSIAVTIAAVVKNLLAERARLSGA